MSNRSITSTNAILAITASTIFPAPQIIEGWSSDSSFMHDEAELSEISMGVDGRMTAGYTPTPRNQTLKLQADSESRTVFELIKQTTELTHDIVWLGATLTLPSTGEVYTFTRGTIQTVPTAQSAQKTLQPVSYKIVWESVKRSII